MLTVDYDGFSGVRARLNGASRTVPVRPIDVALSAATVCGWCPGATPERRRMRFAAIAMEVLAHLSLPHTVPPAAPERLRAVHNLALESTARNELHQRIGVGLARIAARQPEIGLVDLYSLEALSREPAAPLVRNVDGTRRRPDFVGSTLSDEWAIVEAKGRTAKLAGSRAAAIAQAKAVELLDVNRRAIPVGLRAASVASLGAGPVHVYFEDPEPRGAGRRRWQIDPQGLLVHYYGLVRDVLDTYGRRLRPVSGAPNYESIELPGGALWLAVHRHLLAADLEDPDDIRKRRSVIADEADEEQASAVQAGDLDLAIGGDGLALLAPAARSSIA